MKVKIENQERQTETGTFRIEDMSPTGKYAPTQASLDIQSYVEEWVDLGKGNTRHKVTVTVERDDLALLKRWIIRCAAEKDLNELILEANLEKESRLKRRINILEARMKGMAVA